MMDAPRLWSRLILPVSVIQPRVTHAAGRRSAMMIASADELNTDSRLRQPAKKLARRVSPMRLSTYTLGEIISYARRHFGRFQRRLLTGARQPPSARVKRRTVLLYRAQ